MIWKPLVALPARLLAPLSLILLALAVAGMNYAYQVREYGAAAEADERRHLTERLSVEQTRLEIQSGLGNALQVRRLVAALGLRPGTTHAYLVNGDGQVVASLSRSDLGRPLAEVVAAEPGAMRAGLLEARGADGRGIHLDRPAADDALIGHVPVYPGHELIVRLDLAQPLAMRLHAARGELWREAGATMAFAVLLAALLHWLWFRRAAQLTTALRALGEGRLETRAGIEGRDELAEIGAAVDEMASRQQDQQRALRESEARFRAIFDGVNDAIFIHDFHTGTVRDVNARAEQMYGLSRAEIVGAAPSAMSSDVPPYTPREAWAWLERARQGEAPVFEWHARHRDGHLFWVEVSMRRADLAGEPFILVAVRDIEARKRAEEALRVSEGRYRTLAEHLPAVVYAADAVEGGSTLYVSPYIETLLGFTAAEWLADPSLWMRQIHPDDRERVLAQFVRSHEVGTPFDAEYRLFDRASNVRWVHDRAVTVRFAPGQPTVIQGLMQDITEREQVAAALRANEARLRAIIDNEPECVKVVDAGGGLVEINPAGLAMLEAASLAQARERPLIDYVAPEHRAAFAEMHRRVLAGDAGTLEFELVGLAGGRRWVDTHAVPLRDPDGKPVALLGITRDISAARQAQEDLRRVNAELEQRVAERTTQLEAVNRELEAFSYSVSHDLKAPLRGIDGYSQLLVADHGEKLEGEAKLFVDNIRRGVVRMHELIEDLLAYSRMERRSLEARSLDLSALVQGLLETCAGEIAERGAVVDAQVAGIGVRADREGLALVLRNLLENALKFSRDAKPPRIAVGAREEGGKALLWVRDNGIGFDMKYHARIFEIFQRLHRAEDYPGTGVGLALVRKAMQRLGGRVWAESAPGRGATFYLELPR